VTDPEPAVVAAHRAALAGLRALARELTPDTPPASVPDRMAALVAAEDPAPQALDFARTYLFAARVGGAAADHGRAKRWLEGWLVAPRRTPAEAQAAIVDGIRFAQRLHRALGIDDRAASA
jgi:hypothetical protein